MGDIKSGRVWAWFGFALGIIGSVSANVMHSYLVQVERQDSNIVGPLISAAFWPLALFFCLEVMSRVLWPRGWIWWVVRYLGLSLVAGIAAVVSWRHMNGLLATYGEDEFVAIIGPAAVDGLMVVCSSALLAIADNIKRRATAALVEPDRQVANLSSPTSVEPPRQHTEPRSFVPPPSPPREPRPRRELPEPKKPDTKDRNAEAVAAYIKSAETGAPLTGDQLGAMFERSGRWGRDRIAEAQSQPSQVL